MKKVSVNFYLKADKEKNGLCPIYGKIKVGGSSSTFSTGKYISADRWARTKQLSKASRKDNEMPLKEYINSIPTQVIRSYNNLKSTLQEDALITAEMLKERLFGPRTVKKGIGIYEIMVFHNTHFVQLVTKAERASGTIEKYERVAGILQKYIQKKYKMDDYPFNKVNEDFVFGFEEYLKFERRNGNGLRNGISNNTTVKYIRSINTAILYGIKRGTIQTNPFKKYDGKLKEVKTVFLTKDELSRIESKKFEIDRLQTVKDIFLFSCYCSYSPVDAMKLTWNDILIDNDGNHWIKTSRQKSNVDSNVVLLPPVIRILNTYKNDPRCIETKRLLPNLSGSKMNAYLKEISDVCGITKNLTWKVSRNTFATTVTLGNGVSLESVSRMMGHKNIRQTQHYAKILDDSVKKEMVRLKEIYK